MHPDSPLFEELTDYCHGTDNPEANLCRARLMGFTSQNVRVAPGAIIRLCSNSQVKENCFIGLYSYLNGDVTLEENVIIGPHCSITSNTHLYDPATQAFTRSGHAPIVIGRGTWLCAGCSVTAGVTVGKANLICANAVVTKDTSDYAIMAGIPARPVGRIDPQTGIYHWHSKNGD